MLSHLEFSFIAFLTLATAGLAAAGEFFQIGNDHLQRHYSLEDGLLRTSKVVNQLDQQSLTPAADSEELAITIVKQGRTLRLTNRDFQASQVAGEGLSFSLKSEYGLSATLKHELGDGPWLRRSLTISASEPLAITAIEIDSLKLTEAYQPYSKRELTTLRKGGWYAGLGQPLYTRSTGTFWGVEFAASDNYVKEGTLHASYLTRQVLEAGESYTTHSAVLGVGDSPDFIKDAFFSYINQTRARPLHLQVQYNSWFDFGRQIRWKTFAGTVERLHRELHTNRGVPPLSAYVIDDGWQAAYKDWSQVGVWPVNDKFSADFAKCRKAVAVADSHLGLWMSPACLFGASAAIPKMREAGWNALTHCMSMTCPDYMQALEDRVVGLVRDQEVGFFKFDGIFGHLHIRNYAVDGFKGGETELGKPKYDEAKIRYLSLGVDRFNQMVNAARQHNPQLHVVASNGAWLSPWWLQHVDTVWMINAGDAAGGSSRTDELVYRDGIYYQILKTENTQFPINSLFNHEPKKTSSGESADAFRRYLYMNLARGTSFIELYLKTGKLSESDWDVLAEGLKWAHDYFPCFESPNMLGEDPNQGGVYAYTGWTPKRGYLAIHNPSDGSQSFTFTLNRSSGLPAGIDPAASFSLSSPLDGDLAALPKSIRHGESLTVQLPAKAVRLIQFNR
jgi:hypothetical protein